MDNEMLRKVQLCQLKILIEFSRVCKRLNINYFLDSGTLLGAVRHKGFIPWDDDIDVGMLRNDYEKLLAKAPDILGAEFFLQTWYSDDNYGLAFAKLRMRDTIYIEEVAQKSKAENGFYIDIFPYDVYPLQPKEKKWQGFRYSLYRRALMVKSGYMPWIMNAKGIKLLLKKIGYIPIRVYAALCPRVQLIKNYESMSTRFNSANTGFLFAQGGASDYGKWVVPEDCFKAFIDLPFENELFSCPVGYEKYLNSVYGDYMKLPPEDQRINRHRIIEIKFPNEVIDHSEN